MSGSCCSCVASSRGSYLCRWLLLFFCPSACPFVSVCLSVCPCCLCVCLSGCPCCLSACLLSLSLSRCLSFFLCLALSLSLCPPSYLSGTDVHHHQAGVDGTSAELRFTVRHLLGSQIHRRQSRDSLPGERGAGLRIPPASVFFFCQA